MLEESWEDFREDLSEYKGWGGGKHGIPEGRGNTAGMYVWEGHLEVRARARLTRCIPEGRGTAAGT